MKQILVIGEKASQVKKFAEALCGSFSSTKQAKYIYTYTGNWRMADGSILVFTFLPLAGHITTIENSNGFSWNECDPIELVKNPKALKIVNDRRYVPILKKSLEGKDELWLATDPDSEGDNIAWEALRILEPLVKKNQIGVRRIWNASLTKSEILRSFSSPRPWDDHLALAVLGRRFTDAWLGFAGTREVTIAARAVSKVKVISLGRVQLPTLRLIVQRDMEHELFQTTDHWLVQGTLKIQDSKIVANHVNQPFTDETFANLVLERMKGAKVASVNDVTSEHKKETPPIPLNTTAAVALLSKILKKPAATVLGYLEELYLKELISYPRTENTRFSDDFKHLEILDSLETLPVYADIIQKVPDKRKIRSNGKRKGEEDHDPIHPTGEMKHVATLTPELFRTWDIICRYYISHFMMDYEYQLVKIRAEINQEQFGATMKNIVEIGWKHAHNWVKLEEAVYFDIQKGTQLPVEKVAKIKSKTKPPSRLTDSSLLVQMEKLNIGTKSSRPEIIKKLQERNYVSRHKNRLVSTLWGRMLIVALEPIWPDVTTPKFTSLVEEKMDLVARKSVPYPKMLEELRSIYLQLHLHLKSNLSKFRELIVKIGLEDQMEKIQNDEAKVRLLWDIYGSYLDVQR